MSVDGRKGVVITGVSTGIGHGLATFFVAKQCHVFGSVRKPADAERLKAEFGESFTPLMFDVLDQKEVKKAAAQVKEALGGRTLLALINNAGIAWPGALSMMPLEDFSNILNTNLVGYVCVTQAFLPLIGTDLSLRGKPGRVIMMSSTSGRIAPPFMSAYAASKHGIEAVSCSLRREMTLYGIKVVVIAPGHVRTPIWDKADERQIEVLRKYIGTDYEKPMQTFGDYFLNEGRTSPHTPETVARAVWDAVTTASPKARYTLIANPFWNWYVPRWLPQRFVDGWLAKSLGLMPLKREENKDD